ncbi:hypothetical protein UCDDA912_g01424 [Diaporthe ampelina]|uniref:DUF7053 domain-containing protein n=1 Tax=Diaporthe ampelina TaxID=1214573 RepID=A0A0G2FWL4_9PEZI|nr:hypothetical protein UCDDA912_g01424 [Diaporthe ampelina]
MSKRSVFTTISPLPAGIPREIVLDFLHNHLEMIDLNPLVKERHPIKPPADAPADEMNCIWYSLTDRITYLPGGLASGDISYTCAFHDLPDGIQTHCRAPLNVGIRGKWTLCGTLPGEPAEPVELGIGAPASGLYIREDVDLRCNLLMTGFVKKNLKKSHATLVDHLIEKARLVMSGDKDSIHTGQSPSNAAEEKPALTSSSGDDHPEYPSLNPYSDTAGGSSSSLDEPLPPRTPVLFAELAGSQGLGKGEGEGEGEPQAHQHGGAYRHRHPSVLRPGGRAGMGSRLDSPFIAELE